MLDLALRGEQRDPLADPPTIGTEIGGQAQCVRKASLGVRQQRVWEPLTGDEGSLLVWALCRDTQDPGPTGHEVERVGRESLRLQGAAGAEQPVGVADALRCGPRPGEHKDRDRLDRERGQIDLQARGRNQSQFGDERSDHALHPATAGRAALPLIPRAPGRRYRTHDLYACPRGCMMWRYCLRETPLPTLMRGIVPTSRPPGP